MSGSSPVRGAHLLVLSEGNPPERGWAGRGTRRHHRRGGALSDRATAWSRGAGGGGGGATIGLARPSGGGGSSSGGRFSLNGNVVELLRGQEHVDNEVEESGAATEKELLRHKDRALLQVCSIYI